MDCGHNWGDWTGAGLSRGVCHIDTRTTQIRQANRNQKALMQRAGSGPSISKSWSRAHRPT